MLSQWPWTSNFKGIFVHDVLDAIDFSGGFGLDGGLSGVESDGIDDNLAVGGKVVVERHDSLGNADFLDEEDPLFPGTGDPEKVRFC